MVETAGRITLWGVEVFAAIADERSISAAARRLGASPSSVSQQLTNLETAMGTALIDRSARPLVCTPAGELFRRRALTILNEAEQARAELAAADMTRLSRFRLGMIEDFDADVTPALLAELAEEWPRTQFLLETGASHRLLDQLDARALDVVVTADLGEVTEGVEAHPLLEEPFVAAVPKGTDVKVEGLRDMPLIQYSSRHFMGRQIAAHLARERVQTAHRLELDSYHAILAMVAAGAGWTILTPLGVLRAQRFVRDVDIVELPFTPFSRRITLSARRGVLGDLPEDVAHRLKRQLDRTIIQPLHDHLPWLAGGMRLL
ncbi:LysR family transcriptional regulator [Maritimibacter dapengensis]|uniref:LysR family transcriptional regulator n=1 Tax=Maritimibacter dapengensis TaxID=2836868 RepID=A0ABS6SZ30_9RHOB|nr:LysR family transcriptional regulator [Maritimibacter dapengensis]MBV7378238.1 LysR family transcriptional regulator [Maritimibacter dapengensis]